MKQILLDLLVTYEQWIIVYLFVINSVYFLLLVVGFFELLRYRYAEREKRDVLERSTLMPPISVLVPSHNEAALISEAVRALLRLRYPEFEVIVVNDGSSDETLQLLIREFHLYKSARYYETKLATQPVRALYESMNPIPLVVVDKENGGKADALNAGLNIARYPLICAVDADSLLEADALARVAKPFVEEPGRVLAVGGIVRVANGCDTHAGRVDQVRLPRSWLARVQVVEYLRAFLGGRIAFSSFNSLLVISGAFGLFQKAAVLAIGGFRTSTVGEDMEIIIRLHRWARREGKPYRIVFQPDPVCWTQVPETLRVLRRQRNRWQRGTIESLWLHRSMIGRPRYGVLGLLVMPFFVLFEMLGPLVEVAGYFLTLAGFCAGVLSWNIALAFFFASALYGTILSAASVILEELSTRRYPEVRSLLTLVAASVIENLGFRQLLTLWRALAFIDVFRGKKAWGAMERKGWARGAAHGEPAVSSLK